MTSTTTTTSVLYNAATEKEIKSTNDILVHPLVVMNVSDHFTRAKVSGRNKRVVGALFGQQVGRRVEVHTTFELVTTDDDNGAPDPLRIKIDVAYMKQKKEQYTAVFPSYEILGWYVASNTVLECDMDSHKQIFAMNESPLLMCVDCEPAANARALGVYVFETNVEVTKETGVTYSLQRVAYNVESEESERIGVQNVSRVESEEAKSQRSSLVPQVQTLSTAVTMLQSRIQIVLAYLRAVQKGEIETDAALLRQVSSLCTKLPCASSEEFQQSLATEYDDVELIAFLSTLVKGSATLQDVIGKNKLAFDKPGGRRMRMFA
eukprot:PhM_4_TR2215/c0_g1_i1/m.9008/K12179/COPS6, CSN6; COP9 signalosome complex subunit 6